MLVEVLTNRVDELLLRKWLLQIGFVWLDWTLQEARISIVTARIDNQQFVVFGSQRVCQFMPDITTLEST